MNTYKARVYWSKKERDVIYDGPCSPDRHLMHCYLGSKRPSGCIDGGERFDPSLFDELVLRGYDLTTLRLSVVRHRHEWIYRGATIYNRKTGEARRVHHVRYERGVGQVHLVGAGVALDNDLDAWRMSYQPIDRVEEEYQREPPRDMRQTLVAEGAGL